MTINHKRPAIAMIELIFSIVIMGIVLLSVPTLISTAGKSTSVALQQEGISEAGSRINMILTYDWDENNVNSICADFPSILNVTGGDDELSEPRAGIPNNSNSHTFNCSGGALDATDIGLELGGTIDDQDDFDNVNLVDVPLGIGGEDYIEQTTVDIATSIRYVPDASDYNSITPQYDFNPGSSSTTETTNIKAITVTLTSSHTASELEKEITMHAFSCNIGSYRFASRPF